VGPVRPAASGVHPVCPVRRGGVSRRLCGDHRIGSPKSGPITPSATRCDLHRCTGLPLADEAGGGESDRGRGERASAREAGVGQDACVQKQARPKKAAATPAPRASWRSRRARPSADNRQETLGTVPSTACPGRPAPQDGSGVGFSQVGPRTSKIQEGRDRRAGGLPGANPPAAVE